LKASEVVVAPVTEATLLLTLLDLSDEAAAITSLSRAGIVVPVIVVDLGSPLGAVSTVTAATLPPDVRICT
jgi:hypothetical protein